MYDEGMSNALIEAMLCGLAIVASDMPQVTRTFPNEDGLFFPPENIEMLTMHLKRLVTLCRKMIIQKNKSALLKRT